jgi:hypothetical protein
MIAAKNYRTGRTAHGIGWPRSSRLGRIGEQTTEHDLALAIRKIHRTDGELACQRSVRGATISAVDSLASDGRPPSSGPHPALFAGRRRWEPCPHPSKGSDHLDSSEFLDRAWERAGLTTPPGGGGPLANKAAVMRWLSDARERLPRLIAEIVYDSRALAFVASRSYRHSNGFVKVPLQTGAALGEAFRLHMWDNSPADSDIHDHRWDFVSMPILGSFLERRYKLQDGREGQLLECRPRAQSGTIAVTPLKRARAVLIEEAERVAGKPYECHSRVLHAIDPTNDRVAATLVIRGPTLRGSALVHKSPDTPNVGEPMQALAPSLMPTQLSEVLEAVAANI